MVIDGTDFEKWGNHASILKINRIILRFSCSRLFTRATSRTESYSYDNAGNLLTFNNGTISHSYTYGDSQWGDLLTTVDGQSIQYDAVGNPTSYYDGYRYTFTWEQGRQLSSSTYNNRTTNYRYNEDGLRTEKYWADGSSVKYDIVDGRTVGETHYNAGGNPTLYMRYIFDESGSVTGIDLWYSGNEHWTDYYFVKNLQGDVVEVYDTNNTLAASYTYDAWGNILEKSGDLADLNPFRYRTYYFDSETWFYYLQSRYYDPAIGRFINADVLYSTGQGLLGNNMFAYCLNNPIIYLDKCGNSASLPPMIENGLNLPQSGGVPVFIDGTTYYYAIDIQNGQLYEYWFDVDGNLIWARHHSNHNKPWKHDDPHDHKGGKDKNGNNTLVDGPQPVDEKFRGPDQSSHQSKGNPNASYAVAGVAAGVAIYQIVKWVVATFLAPPSYGGSYAFAALLP